LQQIFFRRNLDLFFLTVICRQQGVGRIVAYPRKAPCGPAEGNLGRSGRVIARPQAAEIRSEEIANQAFRRSGKRNSSR
jgi:hypothetical protein